MSAVTSTNVGVEGFDERGEMFAANKRQKGRDRKEDLIEIWRRTLAWAAHMGRWMARHGS